MSPKAGEANVQLTGETGPQPHPGEGSLLAYMGSGLAGRGPLTHMLFWSGNALTDTPGVMFGQMSRMPWSSRADG